MNRRETVIALLAIGASPGLSVAQQYPKVWRIGVLETTAITSNIANMKAFQQGLLDLGYFNGRNYVLEYRSADGRSERFPELAAELVRRKVDLIVTRGTPATEAAKRATTTIPVVTTAIADPLSIVASLARPGGNVTGLATLITELQGKRVELLREILPRLATLASLRNMSNAANVTSQTEVEKVAQSMGIQLLLLDVRKREDLAPAFERAVRDRADALTVGQDSLNQVHDKLIVELAAKHRLPAIFQSSEYVADGGLMSYGVNYPDQYRRAAAYVDKIFKGAKPGELPMEQPTKLDLAINLRTAKALGLTIPQSILLRADKVIE